MGSDIANFQLPLGNHSTHPLPRTVLTSFATAKPLIQTALLPNKRMEKLKMRKHPAWLAAGLLFFAVLACNLGKNNNANNSNNGNKNAQVAESDNGSGAAVKEIYMAKDDGNGKPGDHTSTFEPGDHTIHWVATLKESKAGTDMKFSWWIVDADGEQNKKIKDIDYS